HSILTLVDIVLSGVLMRDQTERSSGSHARSKSKSTALLDPAAMKTDLMAKGVKYCLPAYVDVHGIPKSKSVPISHFERALRGSELFTGAALEGLGQETHEDELALHPDPAAITQLPWRPSVAWMPGN